MFGAWRRVAPSDTSQSVADEVADVLYSSANGKPWDAVVFERAGVIHCIAVCDVSARGAFADSWSVGAMEAQETEMSMPGVNWVIPSPGTAGGAIVAAKKTVSSWREGVMSAMDAPGEDGRDEQPASPTVTGDEARKWFSARREKTLRSAPGVQYNVAEQVKESEPQEKKGDDMPTGEGIDSIISALGKGARVSDGGGFS